MLDDKIKSQLKKLFAVAENDASADGEIANALRSAKNLMDLHQISREDVFEQDGEVNTINVQYADVTRYSRYTSICAWESYLCRFISEFVEGTGYYVRRGQIKRNKAGMATNKKATQITFYGAQTDVIFCGELWDEVSLFIEAAANLRFGSALARGAAAAYAEGFAKGLWEANKRETQKQALTSDSRALVVQNRGLALKEGGRNWLAERGIHLSKGRSTTSAATKSWDAFQQGKADGKNYQPSSQKRAGYLT